MPTRALLCSIAVALLGSALSAAEPTGPRPLVVVIGVSKHAGANVRPRPHAESDAAALYDLFSDPNRIGSGPDRVKLLLGTPDKTRPGAEATRANVLAALTWLGKTATAEDSVLVAFFGAGGATDTGERAYYVSDTTGDSKTAVTAADIAGVFDKLPCRQVTVLLDVHLQPSGPDALPIVLGAEPYTEFLGRAEEKGAAARKGRILFLASNGVTEATDLDDRGLFREAVVAGLRGGADTAGGGDGVVTTAELATWLDDQMPRLRREKAPDGRRTPHFMLGTRSTRAVLIREPTAARVVGEQLAKLDALRKSGTLPDDVYREAADLLPFNPVCEIRRRLRKEYQALADGRVKWDDFSAARTKLLAEMVLPPKAPERFADSVLDVAENLAERALTAPKVSVLTGFAARGLCEAIEEPLPADIARRLDRGDALTFEECRALLADLRRHLGNRSDLANHKDVDIALKRMLAPIDPYTTYIDRDNKRKFNADTRGQFVGIGVQIRKDDETGLLLVVTPIRSGPAHRAGLRAGDLVERIVRATDGAGTPLAKPEVLDTRDLSTDECVAKILGKAGTKVTLAGRRAGEKSFEVELTRAGVYSESVLGSRRKADASWDHMIDPERKIAYIRLSGFQQDTGAHFAAAVAELRKAGMKALILDLRFNPGGYLTTAVEVADLLVADEEVVTVRSRVGDPQTHRGTKAGSQTNFPIVCLVNGYTASGGEIVSACLQDTGRAVVCGERTYGKASVQHTEPFEGGLLKFTMARFYRPSGKNLDRFSTSGTDAEDWGVRPDPKFEVKLTPKERDTLSEAQREAEAIGGPKKLPASTDRQLERALEHLRATD